MCQEGKLSWIMAVLADDPASNVADCTESDTKTDDEIRYASFKANHEHG